MITERGLAATRIADVADRAGTSTSAVLYWFENREQLLTEALIADEDRWSAELEQRLAGLPTASARLLELLRASAAEADWTLWIELWSRALRNPDVAEARVRLDRRWRATLKGTIADGQLSGEFAVDRDAAELAGILACLIDGLGVQVTLADEAFDGGRMLELCIAHLDGLLGTSLEATGARTAGVPA